jgi:hypothetical protein
MSGLRKYTRAQISRAVRLVSEGQSYAKAGRACRMPGTAVRNHCVTAGVLPRGKNGHRTAFAPGARPFTAFEDAFIVQARAFGRSFYAIASDLKRAPSSVRSRLLTLQLIKMREEA